MQVQVMINVNPAPESTKNLMISSSFLLDVRPGIASIIMNDPPPHCVDNVIEIPENMWQISTIQVIEDNIATITNNKLTN